MVEKSEFKSVSLKADLVRAVESFIHAHTSYRSVAEFIAEAARLRLEEIRRSEQNETPS